MTIFYSLSVNGFFDDDIHAPAAIPADAVSISAARHRDLLAAQSQGATIAADGKGRPRINRPSAADLRASTLRRVKREAERRIDAVAPVWRQINDQRAPSPEGAARFAAIDAIRAASDLIESEIAAASADSLAALDLAAHPLWPSE